MKKHLIVAAGLAVLSTSAFASKARLQALGQDTNGSFYLEDTRSVFLNPAFVNEFNNYVVTEWGTANSTGTDSEAAPNAEGGFFRKMGSMAYGLYLGNDDGSHNSTKDTNDMQTTDNNMELFFAGDMGMKWGARFAYSSSEEDGTSTEKIENKTMGLGLGVIHGHMEGYVNLDLKDESKGSETITSDKYEADLGLQVGGSYKMGNVTFFADYEKAGYETTLTASSNKTEVTDKEIAFGAAYQKEIDENSKFFYSVTFSKHEEESNAKATSTVTKETTTTLPLVVGFETKANSWLTLRASIGQNVIINDYEKTVTGSDKEEKTNANTTDVNAGATLTFGKLMIDGVIGTTDGSRTGATVGTKEGVLATDNLMTRVAVNYWF